MHKLNSKKSWEFSSSIVQRLTKKAAVACLCQQLIGFCMVQYSIIVLVSGNLIFVIHFTHYALKTIMPLSDITGSVLISSSSSVTSLFEVVSTGKISGALSDKIINCSSVVLPLPYQYQVLARLTKFLLLKNNLR